VRRVTFSRNYTLSVSRTCRCYCKYCAFATHTAHLYSPEEVERRLDDAVRRNAKELLVLTGERPEPTFLITKPFQRSTVKAAISQALFFDQATVPTA
jgi:2-iminoacetate synthase ThiH